MSIDEQAQGMEGLSADRPWPGLAAYTEAEQDYFFGRDRQIEELFHHVRNTRLALLIARSGLGKTSLLQAGLFPRLRRDNLVPIYVRIDYTEGVAEAEQQVLARIKQVIAEAAIDAPPPLPDDSLWSYFHRPGVEWWSQQNYPLIPVLVFDQFEEIFTIGRNDAVRSDRFLDRLGDLIEERPPAEWSEPTDDEPPPLQKKVVLSFREEFLPHFEGLKRRIHSMFPNRVRLINLGGNEAVGILEQSGGHLISPEVAEEIIRFVAAGKAERAFEALAVEPYLLCVFCRELNERRIAAGAAMITSQMLEGGQQAILQEMLNRAFVGLPSSLLEAVGEYLLTDDGNRTQYPLNSLAKRARVPEQVIMDLVNLRILRTENRDGMDLIELMHDRLAPVVLRQRERWRREKRIRARRRRVAAISIPVFVVGVLLAYLAIKIENETNAAEVTVNSLHNIYQLADPNISSQQKLQNIDAILKLIGPVGRSNPEQAATAYADIEGIELRNLSSLTDMDLPAFRALNRLYNDNPADDVITLAYARGLRERAIAEAGTESRQAAENDDDEAIAALRSLNGDPAALLLRGQIELELGAYFDRTADEVGGAKDDTTDLLRAQEAFGHGTSDLELYTTVVKNDPAAVENLAWAINKSGDIARDSGDTSLATAQYAHALALYQSVGTTLYQDTVEAQNEGVVEMNLGKYKMEDDDPAAALVLFEKAEKIFLAIHQYVPDSPETLSVLGWSQDYIGAAYYRLAETSQLSPAQVTAITEAEAAADQAANTQAAVLRITPDMQQWADDQIHTEALLAAINGIRDLSSRNFRAAVADYGTAITRTQEVLREGKVEYMNLADDYAQRADAYAALGSSVNAMADKDQALIVLTNGGFCTKQRQEHCRTTKMQTSLVAQIVTVHSEIISNDRPRNRQ